MDHEVKDVKVMFVNDYNNLKKMIYRALYKSITKCLEALDKCMSGD